MDVKCSWSEWHRSVGNRLNTENQFKFFEGDFKHLNLSRFHVVISEAMR